MNAAIYARKSTEQHGVADDQKSVARQVEQARAYAASRGWTVADEHVYIDDGISGAEFAGRPGFLRLMNALKPEPPFEALIMSEESRLGREQIEVSYALKTLITAGVRVFCYLTDTERTLNSPIEKAMLALAAMADEMEREKARQRTYDAMARKAKARHVTGGRVFGYDNVEVLGTNGARSHVERRINEGEAAVVRRIFEMAAGGLGKKAIAKRLNTDGAVCPRAQQGRPRGWTPSSVFEVLNRPLYSGVIVWNQTHKRNKWGAHKQAPNPESEWLRVPAPELRIVSDSLWNATQAQLATSRMAYLARNNGHAWGRPPGHLESRYLLTGLCECGMCGGSMVVKTRPHGRRKEHRYGCSSYHLRGKAVCENGLDAVMEASDMLVLDRIGRDLLTPKVADRAVELVQEALGGRSAAAAAADGLRARLDAVEGRIRNLTAAIAGGGSLPSLLTALGEAERHRAELLAQVESQTASDSPSLDPDELREELLQRLKNWRGLLRREVGIARGALRQLLDGRVVFDPTTLPDGSRGYEIRGRLAWGSLFSGLIGCSMSVASPTGFEPVFWP